MTRARTLAPLGSAVPVLIALAALVSSCSGPGGGDVAPAPDPLALQAVADRNADPGVIEIDLEARETDKRFGATPVSKVWSYNGTVPGPLVDAKVGDRLVVHFKNSLPEPTTIHWHGIRLPARMDGALAMQEPVKPGATFDYDFVLKDAGLYWFHPHMRTDVQIEKGLAGVIRVRAADEPASDDERILVLDDVSIKPDGTFPTYLDDDSRMMGRGGNTLLVNGVVDATIPVKAGAVRWRILNVANVMFFNLRLPGRTLRVLGTDGGRFARPYDTDRLLVAPAERYDVMFLETGAPGTEIDLMTDPYPRGHDTGDAPPARVAKVRVTQAAPARPQALPTAFPPTPRPADDVTALPLVLDEKNREDGVVFTINDATFPDVPRIKVAHGSRQIFAIENKSDMDHPFHLHGFFFVQLSKDGVATPDDRLVLKDTVIVPKKSKTRLAATFDEPGRWMYHCHILEHAENGMMGEITVGDNPGGTGH